MCFEENIDIRCYVKVIGTLENVLPNARGGGEGWMLMIKVGRLLR